MDEFNFNNLNEENENEIRRHEENDSTNEIREIAATENTNQGFNPEFEKDQYDLRASSFYTESSKKSSKRKNGLAFQMIAVSLVSSIVGGAVVAGVFQFAAPAAQSPVKNYFSSILPSKNKASGVVSSNDSSGVLKKVEIEKSDSPVTAIAEKLSPSIVGIKTSFKTQTNFFFDEQNATAEGSGIILKSDGYIMTNYHVIENAIGNDGKVSSNAKIEVLLPNKMDKPYTAQVIGGDAKTDLDVIKIDQDGLPVAELGDSDALKVGELAVAIGNPAGLEYMGSVTVGVISGLNRTVTIADGKTMNLVQTDAAINPGNSGGALVNSQGQVIGINTVKMGGNGFEGLGFAIPINKAKEITDSLIQYKYVKGRPNIGITIDNRFTNQIADENNVPHGVLVQSVAPLSGAYKAGIKEGDIITKFDGQKIESFNDLTDLKNKHKPGDVVKVELYRDDKTLTVDLTLSEDKTGK